MITYINSHTNILDGIYTALLKYNTTKHRVVPFMHLEKAPKQRNVYLVYRGPNYEQKL